MLHSLFQKIAVGITALFLTLSPATHNTPPAIHDTLAVGSLTPVQAQKFRLAGAGVTATATSITLQTFKLPDASTTITMADLGTISYGTLEPGTTKEEQISFTGVSPNGDGTATLTGVTRGLDFRASNCSAVSANQKTHAGGTYFILSNTACFYTQYPGKGNTESITGVWTFASSSIPRLNAQGTWGAGTEEYFVTKRYVDGVAVAGAPDASLTQKGVLEIATKSELAAGTAIGGTTARLVPENSYFNATPSATTTVPVTGSGGTLASGFIDQSANYTWAGTSTFSGWTKFTNLTNNGVLLGGGATASTTSVAPGTSGNILQSNGTTWTSVTSNGISSVTAQASTTVSSPNNATTTLATITLPTPSATSTYRMWFAVNNNSGVTAATTSVSIGGTEVFRCDVNKGGIGLKFYEVFINMLNSTSSEYIDIRNMSDNTSTSDCHRSNIFSINLTSAPTTTIAHHNTSGIPALFNLPFFTSFKN